MTLYGPPMKVLQNIFYTLYVHIFQLLEKTAVKEDINLINYNIIDIVVLHCCDMLYY
jgi:hypothetical protein